MTQNYLESSFLSHLRIDDFGEISDLFYHVLVLMYQQGIQVEDIERKLQDRHQVTGNKKDFHQRGDY